MAWMKAEARERGGRYELQRLPGWARPTVGDVDVSFVAELPPEPTHWLGSLWGTQLPRPGRRARWSKPVPLGDTLAISARQGFSAAGREVEPGSGIYIVMTVPDFAVAVPGASVGATDENQNAGFWVGIANAVVGVVDGLADVVISWFPKAQAKKQKLEAEKARAEARLDAKTAKTAQDQLDAQERQDWERQLDFAKSLANLQGLAPRTVQPMGPPRVGCAGCGGTCGMPTVGCASCPQWGL